MPWKIIAVPTDAGISVEIEADNAAGYEAGYAAWLRLSTSGLDSRVADSVVIRLQMVNGAPADGIYTARELAAFIANSVLERETLSL